MKIYGHLPISKHIRKDERLISKLNLCVHPGIIYIVVFINNTKTCTRKKNVQGLKILEKLKKMFFSFN